MKRFLSGVLTLLLLLTLAGCGKSAEVKELEARIDAIGEVTLDSADAIRAAEEAYQALSAEDRAKVDNYAALTAARKALETAQAEYEAEQYRLSFTGTWVPEFTGRGWDPEAITLAEDGTYTGEQGSVGSWSLSEDGEKIQMDRMNFPIFEEDGHTKLLLGGGLSGITYVRESEAEDCRAAKYVAVDLSQTDLHTVFGEPVLLGHMTDEWDEPVEDEFTYYTPSLYYQEGLVLVGFSDDFALELKYYGEYSERETDTQTQPFDVAWGWETWYPQALGDRARGTLYFVRDSYVAENYVDGPFDARTVVLQDGESFECGYWWHTEAPYSEHLY